MTIIYHPQEDHDTWQVFLERNYQRACQDGVDTFSQGLDKLGISKDQIPSINKLSKRLQELSNFDLVIVNKLVPSKDFFRMLSQSIFPICIAMRPKEQIDFYTSPDPDLVHDIFGHCPFLVDEKYCGFLRRFGEFAFCFIKEYPQAETYLGRFYWYTFEFGLECTPQGIKAYGAGILPSKTESEKALNPANQRPFNLRNILMDDYNETKPQQSYYVVDSLNTLYHMNFDELVQEIKTLLELTQESPQICAA